MLTTPPRYIIQDSILPPTGILLITRNLKLFRLKIIFKISDEIQFLIGLISENTYACDMV